jgi:nitrogen fixation NifU-like protein
MRRAFAFWLSTVNFLLMYSAAVLDHFKNPRNAGDLSDASASVEVTNPVCGDVLRLAVRVENGTIAAVRFKAQGCVTAVACASVLTELVTSKTIEAAHRVTAAQISEALGGLPQATFHGAQLAAEALNDLLSKLLA